jgi:LacI family transcriptional regulator, galactose operon repressor
VLSRLFADRVPVVMVSCWADYADCVAVDDQAGIDLAVEHLVALGHQRIGYVSQPFMAAATTRTRAQAFERALLRRGLEPSGEWTLGDDEDFVGAVFGGGEPPTALVAATDHIAMRLIERLEAAGIGVPSDVSVVGFDGIAVGALSRIALTTVAQPADELARQAVALLFNRIERGHDAAPEQHRLAPELVLRGSTAPPQALFLVDDP